VILVTYEIMRKCPTCGELEQYTSYVNETGAREGLARIKKRHPEFTYTLIRKTVEDVLE
jgi:hypothetical protein